MPYEYRTNICRTAGGTRGEAVIQPSVGGASDMAVADWWTASALAGVSGLRGRTAAAGSVPELSGLRLGGVRLERPVPAPRLI